jgi:arylsulfatase A-like enzyme
LTQPTAGASPNVILILTDDQGYGDLGCHGNPHVQTPHIDRLASQSVRLTDFHVSPLCTPTRAALLTGRYSNRTGAWHVLAGQSVLRRDEITLGDLFSGAGYATGIFGKWHLGSSFPYRPQDRGFHKSIVHGGGGIGTTPDFWGNDYTDDTYFHDGQPQTFPGYSTDVLFEQALAFIEAHRQRSFFCYLPTAAPHDPYDVAEAYSRPYRDAGLPEAVARFYGMITNIDDNVGRLLAQLDEWQLTDNTIVIFMTDNGSSGGARTYNAGLRGGKGSATDGGHRAPCFLRWPGGAIDGGRDVDRLAAHIDLLPTLCELCGIAPPSERLLDGRSLARLLRGDAVDWPERTLVVDRQTVPRPLPWNATAVMTQRWRLLADDELYDMSQDREQKVNVAPQHPEVVARLKQEYADWFADVTAESDEPVRLVVGAPEQNPIWLDTWDLRGQCVYMQHQVEVCERADGQWALDVARAGRYEITLRRWPVEVPRAIDDGLVVLRAGKEGSRPAETRGADMARLLVGGREWTAPIPDTAHDVRFLVELDAGPTSLQGWFVNTQSLAGATWGPYYVGVRRVPDGVEIHEASYQERPHYVITTQSADYWLDRQSGGLSRLIDRDGRDWIAYRTLPWAQSPDSTASAFRGIPNMVILGPERGVGHPGWDTVQTTISDSDTITCTSRSGKWRFRWDFSAAHARGTIEQADPAIAYWFLYEGPIAGRWAPHRQYFATDTLPPQLEPRNFALSDERHVGTWQWAYFGDRDVPRVLYYVHEQRDSEPDTHSHYGNTRDGLEAPAGMVVFGFGRGRNGIDPRLRGANSFRIGLREGAADGLEQYAALKTLLDQHVTSSGE